MKKIILPLFLLIFSVVIRSAERPNIILVLADDIGVGDISHYRKMHTKDLVLETPNIDNLAKQGMVFTNAHSPAALCAPSRYAIMTGNNCYRSPFPWGVWGAYEESPIASDQLTLGKLMKEAGYHTSFFGKWHLGGDYNRIDNQNQIYRGPRWKPETEVDITKIVGGGPQQNGFDYSFTFPAGIQDVPYAVYENGKWMPLAKDSEIGFISQDAMTKKGVKLDKSEGLGDTNWDPHDMGPLLLDKAVSFIKEQGNADKPFFMYYCTQAVHLPHTPPAELDGVKIAGTTPSKHIDMIKELDIQMKVLIEALKEQGKYENTLIIFTSDNGGLFVDEKTRKSGHNSSDIYRGGKNSAYEGGHRVPFIASWPGVITKGNLSDLPILGCDILATLADITKQSIPENQARDSYSFLPILKNTDNADSHCFIMLQGGTGNKLIIIEEGWKLIMKENRKSGNRIPTAFFNLNENPQEEETLNLINNDEHQERIQFLMEKYNAIRDHGSFPGKHM